MATEARRALTRIVANYGRLAASLVLGLTLVRLLLGELGNDGFGLIMLLGSTIGLSAFMRDVVRRSMIRELSAAHHSGSEASFRRTYNAALLLATGVGFITVAMFGILLLLLPLFQIPEPLLPAARLFVAAKAFELFWLMALAPPVNMYLVTERMVEYNGWLVVERAAAVVAAAWIAFGDGAHSTASGIVMYGALSAGLVVLTMFAASIRIALADRRLVPALRTVDREAFRPLLHIGGWYAAVLVAMNMHLRMGAVIMNLAFGLWWNTVFGLAMTLTSYMRMIATGMTTGLDAVTGRLSSSQGEQVVRRLVHHSTRLHGLVTFPAALVLLVLAEPLLELWVGGRVQDADKAMGPTITLIRILALGIAVRSISDGWITILYGAGHIARYAPVVIAGGVVSPLLAIGLLFVLPDGARFTAVAWSFSAIMLVVHGGLVPWIAARTLQMRTWELIGPLVRPMAVTLLAAPILLIAAWRIPTWTLLNLAVVLGVFSVVYGFLVILFVADRHERRRFRDAILRR
jgi:O-antigen/teichoic acid export membrane protein